MSRVLLLTAKHYDFQDDGGRRVEGVKLTYLTGDVSNEGDTRGLTPMTLSAPTGAMAGIGQVPGVYDLEFTQRAGRGGRPELRFSSLRFVKPVELNIAGLLSENGQK